jgi:hypothetical protein
MAGPFRLDGGETFAATTPARADLRYFAVSSISMQEIARDGAG